MVIGYIDQGQILSIYRWKKDRWWLLVMFCPMGRNVIVSGVWHKFWPIKLGTMLPWKDRMRGKTRTNQTSSWKFCGPRTKLKVDGCGMRQACSLQVNPPHSAMAGLLFATPGWVFNPNSMCHEFVGLPDWTVNTTWMGLGCVLWAQLNRVHTELAL